MRKSRVNGSLMRIGNFDISADELNITLSRVCISKKTGEEYLKPMGYFSTLENALKFFVDLGVRETQLTDFRIVVQKQEELYKLISEIAASQDSLQSVRKAGNDKTAIKPHAQE